MEKKAQVKKSSTLQVIWKNFLKYVFQENNFLVKQLQNTNALGEGAEELVSQKNWECRLQNLGNFPNNLKNTV